jgi:hypothetical protein
MQHQYGALKLEACVFYVKTAAWTTYRMCHRPFGGSVLEALNAIHSDFQELFKALSQ